MDAISKDVVEATRYFLKLVELGSYSSVKKFYNVELNTIKSKIDTLETFLEVKLVKNVHNRISPTSDGMKYYHSCNKIVKELENTIHNVKQSGFRERQTVKILGSPLFIKIIVDAALPQLQQLKKSQDFSFALDSYQVDNLNGSQYQFDSYSVIQIFNKHLEYLDLDDWIVCTSVDASTLPAYLYGDKDFIKELHNNPDKISEASLVFNRYDFKLGITEFKSELGTHKFNLDNVVYTVDNEIQKANLLKREKVIGFMPQFYHDAVLDNAGNVDKVQGIQVDYPLEAHLILIYKHSKHRKELMDIVRTGIAKIKERETSRKIPKAEH